MHGTTSFDLCSVTANNSPLCFASWLHFIAAKCTVNASDLLISDAVCCRTRTVSALLTLCSKCHWRNYFYYELLIELILVESCYCGPIYVCMLLVVVAQLIAGLLQVSF